ncbi:predicted protein [Uncinocarpus reesii 1704]|uniref:RNA-dependent RNA polymerase n=1 Tax=Uncinocarpus reesii (strain UAMH 1704) TaxID=336963 RepID=C4JLS3_UNCRE|nr:uncharacterized protein UREG_03781 [Uncinocarpus reesii 1704]EEP78935.1 predicted protein [Uncinocarpus reesii 1704]
MASPHTPRTAQGCHRILLSLSIKYNLDLPTSDKKGTPAQRERTLSEKCVAGLTYLHFNGRAEKVIGLFESRATPMLSEWIHKPNQDRGTLPSIPSASFINGSVFEKSKNISFDQRTQLLRCLHELIDSEIRFLKKNTVTPAKAKAIVNGTPSGSQLRQSGPARATTPPPPRIRSSGHSPSKRKSALYSSEVFKTDSSAPMHGPYPLPSPPSLGDEFDDDDLDGLFLPLITTDVPVETQSSSAQKGKQQKLDRYFKPIRSPPMGNGDPGSSFDNNDPFSTPSRPARQTNVDLFMRVSKPAATQNTSPNADKVDPVDTFSTVATRGLERSSFMEGTSTVATSFQSNVGNLGPKPDAGRYQFDDGASESSTVALLQSEEFQKQLAMDLPPTQVADPIETEVEVFVNKLESFGPFTLSKGGNWPSHIPLRCRYEVARVAQSRGVLIQDILPDYQLPSQDYAAFWEFITRATTRGRISLLEKTKPTVWETAVGNFEDAGSSDMVTLTGELDWCHKSEPGYLKFALKPLRLERGHRFARRFGSDRFMEITFPALVKSPEYLKNKGTVVLQSIATWLATRSHYILGRTWRAFYLEDVKSKNKKDGPRSKVHLFAVDGSDFLKAPSTISPIGEVSHRHTPMSVEALVDWHIPFKYNKRQKDCKLFQRLSLALSRTIPTVVVRPGRIVRRKDAEIVMNDGCALMSASLANEIKSCLGLKDENPSCFQGRIAGAKGIWMVDNADSNGDSWIEISDSQLKIKPHPSKCKIMLDDYQLTFEVVSWSRELRPVNLNVQLLMVLQHGGVQTDRLKELVRRESSAWYADFKNTITNEIVSRGWIQKQGLYDRRKTRRIDDFPTENAEQAILLLDSGFHPLRLAYLKELLTTFLKDYCNRLDSLKIRIPESTYAYCIADPYEVLAEDEVHFGFSKPWESYGYTDLDGVDVLLGRNPAHLPNDIQKRRAVFKKELRHFKDVIVFPTVGKVPLAGMLSGGDYDGDQVWVCWDPELVNTFINTPFEPEKVPEPHEFGLVSCSEKLKEPFDFNEFLTKVFVFNAAPSLLGHCTNEHEKLCYYENGIASPGAIQLSHLLGHLADVRKTGYELRRETWKQLWKQVSSELGPHGLRKPAYKQTQAEDDGRYNMYNIIDCLKFEVVRDATTQILTDFDQFSNSQEQPCKDRDLTAIWDETWLRALSERDNGNSALLEALEKLKAQVTRLSEERPYRNCGKPLSTVISTTADLFQSIKPPEFDHELSHTWRNWNPTWQILVASRVYYFRSESYFPWFAAGPILCEIKARAVGAYRMVTMPVYETFRVNQRAAKRAQEASESSREEIEKMLGDSKELEGDDGEDDFEDWKSFVS